MTPSTPACTCQDQHRRGYCTEPGCPYSTPAPTDAGALADIELAERIEKALMVSLMQQSDDPGPLWTIPLPHFEQARIVSALRKASLQETRGDEPVDCSCAPRNRSE